MHIDVISIFPQLVESVIDSGVVGRAAERGLIELKTWNPRDFTTDRHRSVDDRPYGGGPGMLMKVEPLWRCINAVRLESPTAKLVYLSPQGEVLTQDKLQQEASNERLIFLCGRYEGVDERMIEQQVDEEWSLGDYVISGGELAAMVCIDALSRLIPGVLGHEDSAQQDSFSDGLLDCPHYTRPEEFNGLAVPKVLLNGNHQEISDWRLEQSLLRTWQRRPDLLQQRKLTEKQQALLKKYQSKESSGTDEH